MLSAFKSLWSKKSTNCRQLKFLSQVGAHGRKLPVLQPFKTPQLIQFYKKQLLLFQVWENVRHPRDKSKNKMHCMFRIPAKPKLSLSKMFIRCRPVSSPSFTEINQNQCSRLFQPKTRNYWTRTIFNVQKLLKQSNPRLAFLYDWGSEAENSDLYRERMHRRVSLNHSWLQFFSKPNTVPITEKKIFSEHECRRMCSHLLVSDVQWSKSQMWKIARLLKCSRKSTPYMIEVTHTVVGCTVKPDTLTQENSKSPIIFMAFYGIWKRMKKGLYYSKLYDICVELTRGSAKTGVQLENHCLFERNIFLLQHNKFKLCGAGRRMQLIVLSLPQSNRMQFFFWTIAIPGGTRFRKWLYSFPLPQRCKKEIKRYEGFGNGNVGDSSPTTKGSGCYLSPKPWKKHEEVKLCRDSSAPGKLVKSTCA